MASGPGDIEKKIKCMHRNLLSLFRREERIFPDHADASLNIRRDVGDTSRILPEGS